MSYILVKKRKQNDFGRFFLHKKRQIESDLFTAFNIHHVENMGLEPTTF